MNLKKAKKIRKAVRKEVEKATAGMFDMPFKDRLWLAWHVLIGKQI